MFESNSLSPARALAVGGVVLLGATGMAATATPASAQETSAPPVSAATREAAVSRSASKATTYKIGTATINLGALTYAFGSVIDGGVLAAGTAMTSWAVYAVNDYLWDTYYPAPAKQSADEKFDARAETWRTTLKYLTFKPLGMGQKFVWLYAYTGSASTMMTWGLSIAAANTVWFYANDMGWDWYDWYASQPAKPSNGRVLSNLARESVP